jgi:hypothetical protein
MKKSLLRLTLLLCLTVIGAKGGCQGNADKPAAPTTSGAPGGLLHAPAAGVTQSTILANWAWGGITGRTTTPMTAIAFAISSFLLSPLPPTGGEG